MQRAMFSSSGGVEHCIFESERTHNTVIKEEVEWFVENSLKKYTKNYKRTARIKIIGSRLKQKRMRKLEIYAVLTLVRRIIFGIYVSANTALVREEHPEFEILFILGCFRKIHITG